MTISSRRILLLASMLGLCLCLAHADDTIYAQPVIHQYADTFRLKDQPYALSENELLLRLVTLQAQQIHRRDSLRNDSLLADLLLRDSLLQTQLQLMHDSIDALRLALHRLPVDTPVAQAPLDPMRHEFDSVEQALAHEHHIDHALVERSIFRDAEADMQDMARALRRQTTWWQRDLYTMAQFTQNYISPNWYKGGRGNFAVLGLVKATANYNRDKISWENLGEWRVGVSTTPGDTLRKYNVTDDLFRIYSKFGYRVAPKLYGSASLEFNTTLWNVWNSNNTSVKTAFMTPAKFYFNIGIDYKPIDGLSIVFAPATYKMVYAHFGDGDSIHNVNVTNYGIAAGQHLLNEFGSTLRVQWKYKPLRELALDSEFYLYTNYHMVEIDWEINCDFIINRFLTTRVTLHPRFDSSYIADGDTRPHLQFKELLSIGFAHTFR